MVDDALAQDRGVKDEPPHAPLESMTYLAPRATESQPDREGKHGHKRCLARESERCALLERPIKETPVAGRVRSCAHIR